MVFFQIVYNHHHLLRLSYDIPSPFMSVLPYTLFLYLWPHLCSTFGTVFCPSLHLVLFPHRSFIITVFDYLRGFLLLSMSSSVFLGTVSMFRSWIMSCCQILFFCYLVQHRNFVSTALTHLHLLSPSPNFCFLCPTCHHCLLAKTETKQDTYDVREACCRVCLTSTVGLPSWERSIHCINEINLQCQSI
jgi:hypothetical protein